MRATQLGQVQLTKGSGSLKENATLAGGVYLVDSFWVFRHIKDDCSGSPLHCSLGLAE